MNTNAGIVKNATATEIRGTALITARSATINAPAEMRKMGNTHSAGLFAAPFASLRFAPKCRIGPVLLPLCHVLSAANTRIILHRLTFMQKLHLHLFGYAFLQRTLPENFDSEENIYVLRQHGRIALSYPQSYTRELRIWDA